MQRAQYYAGYDITNIGNGAFNTWGNEVPASWWANTSRCDPVSFGNIKIGDVITYPASGEATHVMLVSHVPYSRGKGQSAVSKAAYRSGENLTNEYDGITHDYTRKGGVTYTEILLPEHAPKEYFDRSTLWNAVEKIENAKNSQLALDRAIRCGNDCGASVYDDRGILFI